MREKQKLSFVQPKKLFIGTHCYVLFFLPLSFSPSIFERVVNTASISPPKVLNPLKLFLGFVIGARLS